MVFLPYTRETFAEESAASAEYDDAVLT